MKWLDFLAEARNAQDVNQVLIAPAGAALGLLIARQDVGAGRAALGASLTDETAVRGRALRVLRASQRPTSGQSSHDARCWPPGTRMPGTSFKTLVLPAITDARRASAWDEWLGADVLPRLEPAGAAWLVVEHSSQRPPLAESWPLVRIEQHVHHGWRGCFACGGMRKPEELTEAGMCREERVCSQIDNARRAFVQS